MDIIERLQGAIDDGVPLGISLHIHHQRLNGLMAEAIAEIKRLRGTAGQSFTDIKQEIKRGG